MEINENGLHMQYKSLVMYKADYKKERVVEQPNWKAEDKPQVLLWGADIE